MSPRPPLAQTYNAFINQPFTDKCYTNFDATHHIISDLANLNFSFDYRGSDTVKIGNGLSLGISHIGSSFNCTPSSTFL